MKLLSLAFSTLTACLLFTGCSSTPTRVDKDPIQARTFNFIGTMPKAIPGYADQRQLAHTLVQRAITKNLASRGITAVGSGGDVIVAYLIIVGNNATIMSVNDFFGYRAEDSEGLQNKAYDAYTGSRNPAYFEAGTLVIDFIDPKSFKVLQRHYATKPVVRDLTEEARAARIQEVVDKILGDVRFAQ